MSRVCIGDVVVLFAESIFNTPSGLPGVPFSTGKGKGAHHYFFALNKDGAVFFLVQLTNTCEGVFIFLHKLECLYGAVETSSTLTLLATFFNLLENLSLQGTTGL